MKKKETSQQLWEAKYSSRSWGRYPPEDLVRFIARSLGQKKRSECKVLELGCGPGPNLWYMHREGYQVAGIDFSPTAIEQAGARLAEENQGLNSHAPDLKVGDFSSLPWESDSFDAAVDIYGICANRISAIRKTISEVYRVLKPGGLFYTKQWGRNCTGYGEGLEIEDGTYDEMKSGVCQGSGINHFFTREELEEVFHAFQIVSIDIHTREETAQGYKTEEFLCQFRKPLK